MKIIQTITSIFLAMTLVFCEAKPEKTFYGIPQEEANLILLGSVLNYKLQDTGNGTIIDSSLGVEWKKCSQGQSFRSSQNDCQGTISGSDLTPTDQYNYGAGTYAYCNIAGNDCNSVSLPQILSASPSNNAYSDIYNSCDADTTNNRTDWRVPTSVELEKLVIGGKVAMIEFFPNTVSSYYWSSVSNEQEPSGLTAKAIHFGEDKFGDVKNINKDNKLYLRCVRNL